MQVVEGLAAVGGSTGVQRRRPWTLLGAGVGAGWRRFGEMESEGLRGEAGKGLRRGADTVRGGMCTGLRGGGEGQQSTAWLWELWDLGLVLSAPAACPEMLGGGALPS